MSAPSLEALMAVQDLDTELAQARYRLAHLPERTELDGVLAERAALAGERGQRGTALDDVVSRQTSLEAGLAATEARSATVSRRLYSGEVVAFHDLQALSADIDTLKARASSLEDEILAVMEQREPLDAAVAALDARDSALATREKALRARLEEAERAVTAEVGALDARRGGLLPAVPAELLATYDRLRARLGGIGAARLVGGHCDGCHLELPATELDRIRHLPADALVYCDHCGRILVRPEGLLGPGDVAVVAVDHPLDEEAGRRRRRLRRTATLQLASTRRPWGPAALVRRAWRKASCPQLH